MSTAISIGIDFVNLVLIAILSRSVSSLEVLLSKPMSSSQYATMSKSKDKCACKYPAAEVEATCKTDDTSASTTDETEVKSTKELTQEEKVPKKNGITLLIVQLTIYLALGFWCSSFYAATALISAATVFGTFIAITYAKKQLGGMSGDVAGYGIVWGELVGIFSLILC